MEQIIGAPQRVLAMLPTANQLFKKAKGQIADRMRGMGGIGNQGVGFNTYTLPALFGGNAMAALASGNFGADARYIGTQFMPSHVPMTLPNAINWQQMYGQGVK
jgi:hypothetical protein